MWSMRLRPELIACLLSALPLATWAQDNCQALTDTSVILSVVTEQFYDRSFNGLNWPAEVASAVESVDCDDSPTQVTSRINALLSRLGASHTAAFSTEELDYWALNSQYYFDSLDGYPLAFAGILAEREEEKWFVSAVLDGSVAAQAGVQVGDELLQLNNNPFSPTGFVPGDNRLRVSPDGSDTREIALSVPQQSLMRAFVDASSASARVIELDAGNDRLLSVGYYRIWAGRDPIQRDFQSTLDEYYDADIDALVVDLRGGLGATSADYLAPVRYLLARKKMPVHFLIDVSVFGGKELLASLVRHDGLGQLVGATTAGEHRPARVNRLLNDRYFLMVATGAFPAPEGGVIEGVGVEPDIAVETCTRFCAGHDPILDASLQILASAVESDS